MNRSASLHESTCMAGFPACRFGRLSGRPVQLRAGKSAEPADWKVGATDRAGFILVGVLVVILLASMVVLSLMFHLRAEETAAAAGSGSDQAWAAAMTGIYEAMRIASAAEPGSLDWQDNPDALRERLFFDDGSERWYFTVYSGGEPPLQTLRYGLTDEASKLNLNTASEEMLGKLPNMTPYLVQGLLDFLDGDSTPRPEGAEQEYYDTLPTPYAIRNGPLATLDEILLVRGFTPSVYFGEDANLNFQLDPAEDDGDDTVPPDNKDGKLDGGFRSHVTIASFDLNQDNERKPRINLNDAAAALPETGLPASLAPYIAALRRSHVTLTNAAELLEAKGKFKDEKGKDVDLPSGVGKEELAAVLDQLTATDDERLPGLININTASAAVLQTLPGVDEALAESIVSARANLRSEQRRTPAWLYEEGLVEADQFKKLAPYLTARSLQFHVQVVGYGVPSGRFRVLEAVVDLAGAKPAITYLRDLTRLGLPFKIEMPAEDEIVGKEAAGG